MTEDKRATTPDKLKVLITGGNGFVGSHIADELARRGHDLRLLLRHTSDTRFLDGLSYERIDGDLRDESALKQAVEGMDAVVHSAGITSALNEAAFMAVNAEGTAALAEAAATAGVRRFVYVSSLAAQGPSQDGRYAAIGEAAHPLSAYGRSKLAGEEAALQAQHRISVASVRLPAVYGPRDRGFLPLFRLVRLGVMPLYGDGLNQVSWIHAYDAASSIAIAVEGGPTGAVYTVSDGEPHTWRELASTLSKHLGRRSLIFGVPPALYSIAGAAAGGASRVTRRPLPLSRDKVLEMGQRYWICDNARISSDLGWEPKIGADQGIAMTLRWYREHRWL